MAKTPTKKTAGGKSPKRPPARLSKSGGATVTKLGSGPKRSNKTSSQTGELAGIHSGRQTCPIVVIGASAGGLSAFKKFLAAMPVDSGVALVLIPHLDPTHESLMRELLARQTTMVVSEAEHGMTIEPNRVYVIPPNRYLAVSRGQLELSELPEPRGFQTAIDFCLISLASDQQERAIGIILSGTGSHGTRGLKEIKLAGGMVMAQAPESAEYDQMPRSAIATGLVDYVLSPEQMPEALVGYVQYTGLNTRCEIRADQWTAADLDRLLVALKSYSKTAFRGYRENMLLRRVQRRMGLLHLSAPSDYVERLREDADEVTRLSKDLLISVTAFFREPEAFRVLAEQVAPDLVDKADADRPVRVWVPGCATGEEAYSIAMVLIERFASAARVPNIQIFATDLDERALAFARRGVYPDSIAADLSAERLRQFFVKSGEHHYEISKQLRESIVFAPQDLIGDAPFSRLDLISCRNVLIYFQPDIQAKVISVFHFALHEGGYLLLGPSESIGAGADLFEPVSKKWRVYRRVGPVWRDLLDIPIIPRDERRLRIGPPGQGRRPSIGVGELLQRTLLQHFAPAAVLVTRKYEILAVQGPVVEYLEFPSGELTKDLTSMVRQGLRTRVRAACQKAVREQRPVAEPARVVRSGALVPCTITVQPIGEPKEAEGLLLVVFQDRAEAAFSAKPSEPMAADEAFLVRQLEDELRRSREDLQSTIEDLETSNEELKASHEESISMNEELQSANEELETSKEELQSLNEELSTVNSQLREKLEELEQASDDIVNLISSAEIATVFLDEQLRIQRFTPPTAKLLNLLATDLGRPFGDLALKTAGTALLDDCRKVLARLTPVEKEVRTAEGVVYLRRVVPYRTADDRIAGVVIAFVDITERIAAEAQSRRFATVLIDSNDAVMLQDLNGRVIAWNRGAERIYGYREAEALQMNISDIVPDQDEAEAVRLIQRIIAGEIVEPFETQRLTHDGRLIDVSVAATRLDDEAGHPVAVATTERDITARKRAEAQLRQLNATLEQRVSERTAALEEREQKMRAILETAPDGIITIDARGAIQTFNRAAERMFGYSANEVIGENVKVLMPAPYHDEHDEYLRRYAETRQRRVIGRTRELTARRKNGSLFPIAISVSEIDHSNVFTGIINDLTERNALQQEILDIATREQQRIGQDLHDGTQQTLTGLGLLAQNLSDALEKSAAPERELAAKLASGIAAANREVRQLASGLVPVPVHADGLMASLDELAAVTSKSHRLSCNFDCPQPVKVSDDLAATHLYRIAQEAVTNAIKHAKADRIDVSLKKTEDTIRLEVRDNGGGIERPGNSHRGLGLRIMAYRCAAVGGTLKFERRHGGGTLVACTLPGARV